MAKERPTKTAIVKREFTLTSPSSALTWTLVVATEEDAGDVIVTAGSTLVGVYSIFGSDLLGERRMLKKGRFEYGERERVKLTLPLKSLLSYAFAFGRRD